MSQQLQTTADEESSETTIERATSSEIVSGAGSEEINLKEMELAGEDNALVQEAGSTGPQKRQVDEEWLADFLAEQIYSENSAFVREYLQNAESASIRACKQILRHHPDYGEEWLGHDLWVNAETGETLCEANGNDRQAVLADFGIADEHLRRVSLPRTLSSVVEAARSVGYDPTIEISLFRDEREIHIEDNGIGMSSEEFDKAFNYTGKSVSKNDSSTGGKIGAGALTFGNLTGKDGGMWMYSRTRDPDAPPADREGIKAYTYLGGYNPASPDDIGDDFFGTRFEIPIRPVKEGGPALSDFQGWVEEYADALRVPVLYREFENGNTPTEEEYGGQSIVEKFSDEDGNEPPVVIERPGEFTAVAGPDLALGSQGYRSPDLPDTWLISMPIERNTSASVSSFWDVGVQWHNEQAICIDGPHRGILKENVEDIHDDDVFGPTPTGTRDQLNRDTDNKQAHTHVAEAVKAHELAQVTDIVEAMIAADHPADAIREDPQDWKLFRRMVDYHGTNATRSRRRFGNFVEENEAFPDPHFCGNDVGPETEAAYAIEKIYQLFEEVSHAPAEISGSGSRKKSRHEDRIGDILSEVPPENVYMAASTGGNFADQRRVVHHNHDKWDVVVVNSSSDYAKYEEKFGFNYLKHVPVTRSDDHDYEVPKGVHDRNQRVETSSSSSNQGKASAIAERKLKIRDKPRNQSIDKRWSIKQVKEYLQKKGGINGKKLVLFPSGKDYENISDHYVLQKYAAIASCNQTEFENIKDAAPDSVFTYEEFREWSLSTVIATEKGGRQVRDLCRDDEYIVLLFARNKDDKRLLSDENETLRNYYVNDVVDQQFWDDEPDEGVLAVADSSTLSRAEYGLKIVRRSFEDRDERQEAIEGLRLSYTNFPIHFPFHTSRLDGSKWRYKKQAETPNWYDGSNVYGELKNADPIYEEFLMACHDMEIDPTVLEDGEVRRIVNTLMDPDDLNFFGEPADSDTDDDTDDDSDEGMGELFG